VTAVIDCCLHPTGRDSPADRPESATRSTVAQRFPVGILCREPALLLKSIRRTRLSRIIIPEGFDRQEGEHMVSFSLNNRQVSVDADARTPLLWVIRDHVGLTGTKYGCGAGLCGACTVHVDGTARRACQTELGSVAGKKVITIEGLSPNSSHPLQKAWIADEVPQCGYCQSGQIMKAAELLAKNPKPSRADIIAHMDGNICRCGTYHRIIAAIERAAREG
jgi:isoquinoline 1-oxidoreductase alpha subunit